ncbi:hypothetical protein B7Y92_03055 [Candidatus Saccharibacteria bacterium 32-50-13]|nr:MAG: hypothetical protein B7Y92_03055 [Candidatus Saccharibacteria bacterium 32-50-13]
MLSAIRLFDSARTAAALITTFMRGTSDDELSDCHIVRTCVDHQATDWDTETLDKLGAFEAELSSIITDRLISRTHRPGEAITIKMSDELLRTVGRRHGLDIFQLDYLPEDVEVRVTRTRVTARFGGYRHRLVPLLP